MIKAISVAGVLFLTGLAAFGQDDFTKGQARPQLISIGEITKPPVLDGNLDDWPADTTGVVIGSASNGVRRHFNWTGTRDSSAVVRLAWDANYFYLAADVCDDLLAQVSDEKEIYQGDSLELFFNTHPQQHRVDGFWQIAIAPPLKEGESLRVIGAQKPFEGVEGKTQVYPGGYTLECRIPWKNLTGFMPAIDQYLGFQLMLDDRDKTRKSQQIWYPSAVTFAQPTHMHTLLLRHRGDTSLSRVEAGPNTWCIADQNKMPVSVIADVDGAKSATITMVTGSAGAPQITLPLDAIGLRIKVAQGVMAGLGAYDGLCDFGVTVAGEQGQTLAVGHFQAELSARPFARIQELTRLLPKRLDELAKSPVGDPMVKEGLALWMRRCSGLISNEAKVESTNRRLLDQLVEEMNALDAAITRCQAGENPYDGMTGSFIKAYTSPLTNKPRPIGLLIPKEYQQKADKRWPLIYILHGIFADERQLSLMAAKLRDLGAIVCQAPAYRQFDWGGVSAAESWTGLDLIMKGYKIDPDRIYLVGHAIGGRGAWQLAEGRSDVWAACAPLLSGADAGPKWPATRLYPQYFQQATEFLVSYSLYRAPEPPQPFKSPLEKKLLERASLASRLENLVGLPLRHSYGEENADTAAERLAIQDRCIELGMPLSTHYVPGAAHGAVAEEWNSGEFFQWLLSHRRATTPSHVTYIANGLRYNQAWWVRVDQMITPADLGRIEAMATGNNIEVKTSGLSAFSLLPAKEIGREGAVTIDGQTVAAKGSSRSFVRSSDGKWKSGQPKASEKKHGLSGPIDDFQFDRFMIVYGTQGDASANAALAKLGKRFSDWGLGSVFECKADRDVTEADLRESHLVLIGSPQTNSVLAKMKDALPMKWNADGFSMGSIQVSGPGAGACFIQPNPLAPDRYAVIITAQDEEGYEVWPARGPSDDFLFGYGKKIDGKPTFTTSAHGCFDNQWRWSSEGTVVP